MRKRIEQVIWVLDHRRDLEADFRAFFHLDPRSMYALPGPEFFALAVRTVAFQGVMASRVMAMKDKQSRTTGRTVSDFNPNRPPTGDRNQSLIEYTTTSKKEVT